ncbi:arylesterase [Kordiimonas sediminis]|uniref:Arylesterase n=1 Tax=Kordiimonas sediminis TaxID=1735581 RepID=A0A919AJW9_9PROT|nr:arylesterase [Kordiimonas sediminis]GHF12034.1 arylesterase [Kordiimonas sediminis]
MSFAFIRALWSNFAAFVLVFALGSAALATDGAKEPATVNILAFGDSLTAGYGLGPGDGFTDQLEVWLNSNMKTDATIKVTNGGVSGDTTSGGRSRLDWSLAPFKDGKPDLVILGLGGNDGLRGIDPAVTRDNMDAMVKTLTDRDIPVLLLGMLAPPNLGPDYAAIFDSIYKDLSVKYGVELYPFFLDGVAAIPELNQPDGIHPTKEGVTIIVSKVGPVVQAYLTSLDSE